MQVIIRLLACGTGGEKVAQGLAGQMTKTEISLHSTVVPSHRRAPFHRPAPQESV